MFAPKYGKLKNVSTCFLIRSCEDYNAHQHGQTLLKKQHIGLGMKEIGLAVPEIFQEESTISRSFA
jgi:hypothetical protein